MNSFRLSRSSVEIKKRAWSTLKKSIIMISLLICFIGLTATYMSEKIKNDGNQDLNELFVQNGNIRFLTDTGIHERMILQDSERIDKIVRFMKEIGIILPIDDDDR